MRVPTSWRSTTRTSRSRSISAVGSRVSLYREYTGTRRMSSRPWPVSIMFSCTSDRNPCCGPKRAASRTRVSAARRSATWRSSPSIEAGLQTMPTRRPARVPDSSRRSDPSTTRMRVAVVVGSQSAVSSRARRLCDCRLRLTCLPSGELIGYARLVVSPACFARAESRSSLNPDSFPHQRERRADVRHLSGRPGVSAGT